MSAPVAVFAHKRPDHLRLVLDALARNSGFEDATLFVYSDGAQGPHDQEAVARVRGLVASCGLANVKLIESPRNRGLVESIRHGVGELTDEFGRVIVVEDDLVVGRHFLQFMNAGLDRYQSSDRVFQICGSLFPAAVGRRPRAFFVPLASSWGWATWKSTWDEFATCDLDGGLERLRRSSALRRGFDLDGQYPMYFTLRRSAAGRTQSWAVWFQLYAFLNEKLALWPPHSLVGNIGVDGAGVHGRWFRRRSTDGVAKSSDDPVSSFPDSVEVDEATWAEVRRSIGSAHPRTYRVISSWTGLVP